MKATLFLAPIVVQALYITSIRSLCELFTATTRNLCACDVMIETVYLALSLKQVNPRSIKRPPFKSVFVISALIPVHRVSSGYEL